ncbi:MAG: hypothetical protein Q4D56_04160 [Bacteroides sp.]|nr:hypothetical protein [Bacteroides sp.]
MRPFNDTKRRCIIGYRRWLAVIPCLVFCCLTAMAQQFDVRSFRQLPNDISAYIDPVRDLNGEACALVKVVGDADFAFSTPLGIVQRRNDVGEIWLYLPHGSLLLTIKHPQWGVLRDYRFANRLESRMTYELVLSQPIVLSQPEMPELVDNPILPDTLPHRLMALPVRPLPRPKRPIERMHYLLMGNIGLSSENISAGLRLGMMRRHGAYLLLQTDFHSIPDTQGECNREGVPTGESISPYYTGRTETGRWMVLAGGMHRLVSELCLYEGIGYGRYITAWETSEGVLLRNTAFSTCGISAEIGLIWRFRRWAVSAGALTIAAQHWEGTVGVGWHF